MKLDLPARIPAAQSHTRLQHINTSPLSTAEGKSSEGASSAEKVRRLESENAVLRTRLKAASADIVQRELDAGQRIDRYFPRC